jgi:ribosome biogenesis GTPase A
MHNRDLIWTTASGKEFKIRDMTGSHLENTLKHIDKNLNAFVSAFGTKRIDNLKYNIKQEIRLRKLNRLSLDWSSEWDDGIF